MAKRGTNVNAKAGKRSAAKKQHATSNDKATKVNGNNMDTKLNSKAKVGKSTSTKKSKAKNGGAMAKAIKNLEALLCAADKRTKVNGIFGENYFNILPLEMTECISTFLDDGKDASDKDLVNFALVCRSTCNASTYCSSSVWRERFSERYEMVSGYSALALKKEYQDRQMILRNGPEVVLGISDKELVVVNMLKRLIVESFAGVAGKEGKEGKAPYSKNMARIAQMARKSRILDNIHRFVVNDDRKIVHSFHYFSVTKVEVQAVQLALCHLSFRTNAPPPYQFQFSQMAAYGHPVDHPLLTNGQLNLEYLLFLVNFFQYHMSSNSHGGLKAQMKASKFRTPKGWTQQLQNGLTELGSEWNCAYAHTRHPDSTVPLLRYGATPANGDYYHDSIRTNTLALNFSTPLPPIPPLFQSHLRPFPPTVPSPQPGIDYHQFSTDPTRGNCKHLAAGVLHPLEPQHGIPGFQRITWMGTPDDRTYLDESDLLKRAATQNVIHEMRGRMVGYEGCVLPGGKIMLGRWWDAKQTPVAEVMADEVGGSFRYERTDMGPFLFWAKE